MNCDICDTKAATVHLTQTAGGSSLVVDLCEDCARKMGVNDAVGFSLTEVLHAIKAAKASRGADQKGQEE